MCSLASYAGGGCTQPERVAAPDLAPPPAAGAVGIDREQAVQLAEELTRVEGPERAIRELDQRPFAFDLDPAALDWFEERGLHRQVLDYLRKRARVDWRSLRGDIDPTGPR